MGAGVTEVYSEPCKTFKDVVFWKIVNCQKLLAIIEKRSILNV